MMKLKQIIDWGWRGFEVLLTVYILLFVLAATAVWFADLWFRLTG